MMPASELSVVNMDPEDPLPYSGEGILLDDLPPAAIDGMVEAFVGSTAAACRGPPPRRRRRASDRPTTACSTRSTSRSSASPSASAFDAAMLEAVDRPRPAACSRALAPWDSGRRYLNFAESPMDPRSIYPVEGYDRLVAAKARYDPTGLFLANHPVVPR